MRILYLKVELINSGFYKFRILILKFIFNGVDYCISMIYKWKLLRESRVLFEFLIFSFL